MTLPLPLRPWTVEEFDRMGETGIFTEDDRVELLQGVIYELAQPSPREISSVAMLNRLLHRQLGDDVLISVSNPIHLSGTDEPMPDLAIVRTPDDERGLPTAADILLVVEVTDVALDYHRGRKLPLYAAAGIPEAWVVDLGAGRVERHSEPGPRGYRQIRLAWRGERLSSAVLPSATVDVDEVLGPPPKPSGVSAPSAEG